MSNASKLSGAEVISMRVPKDVKWTPQEDITTYELARAMHTLLAGSVGGFQFDVEASVLAKPLNVQRHFTIVERGAK